MPTTEQLLAQRITELEGQVAELQQQMKDVLPAVVKLWRERQARKQEGTA